MTTAEGGPFRVGVLHGPNLNLLGTREPEVYGRQTLAEIDADLEEAAGRLGCTLRIAQKNGEGELVEAIHALADWAEVLILNPAAYTHYSLALLDALRAVKLPAIEVHLSNPEAREEYRRVSVVAPACVGKVAGFGGFSYRLALEAAVGVAAGRRAATTEIERERKEL
jgi:3-dehydroquinate dehydratase-2